MRAAANSQTLACARFCCAHRRRYRVVRASPGAWILLLARSSRRLLASMQAPEDVGPHLWSEEDVVLKTHELLDDAWRDWEAAAAQQWRPKEAAAANLRDLQTSLEKLQKYAVDLDQLIRQANDPRNAHPAPSDLPEFVNWCDQEFKVKREIRLLKTEIKMQKRFKKVKTPTFFLDVMDGVARALCVTAAEQWHGSGLRDRHWLAAFDAAVDWISAKQEAGARKPLPLPCRPLPRSIVGRDYALAVHDVITNTLAQNVVSEKRRNLSRALSQLITESKVEEDRHILHEAMQDFILTVDENLTALRDKAASKKMSERSWFFMSSVEDWFKRRTTEDLMQGLAKRVGLELLDITGPYVKHLKDLYFGFVGTRALFPRQGMGTLAALPANLTTVDRWLTVYVLGWALFKEHRRLKITRKRKPLVEDGEAEYTVWLWRMKRAVFLEKIVDMSCFANAADAEKWDRDNNAAREQYYTESIARQKKEKGVNFRGLHHPRPDLCEAWFLVQRVCLQYLHLTTPHEKSFMLVRRAIMTNDEIQQAWLEAINGYARDAQVVTDANSRDAYDELFERLVDRYLRVWQGEVRRKQMAEIERVDPIRKTLKNGRKL